MPNSTLLSQIDALEREIQEKKEQLTELRKSVPDKLVKNYSFETSDTRKISLIELFGDKDELIVIHNMGKSCSYCTMWADGFNGVYHHLVSKVGFVLASPDPPSTQENIAAERNWKFPMFSTTGSSFTEDMGFQNGKSLKPGVSTFYKDENDNIYLYAQAPFGPGDDFCNTWPLFDLLPSGSADVVAKKKLNNNSPFQLTNNVAIGVKDFEKAIKFYINVLGMQMEKTVGNEMKLSISGTNFYVEKSDHNNTFFEFAVEDFESAKELLLQNNCIITQEYSDKSLMLEDPYGLKFHLFQV
ncbi:DUF899 family protein [Psychrobacillus vulpis]|uniref:DUF899 domain-containing protein n=1 Tax=Psychrobacillus vulpis TaxID=2325572 RepID=A0A544TPI2_9BACI|nr:DUF899 family protein [Psychrobacillus vulpis]TQR19367.1 DUF899 domain-containing protein [Psychrobacillus vulpis]